MKARTDIEITGWDEKPYDDLDGEKTLAHAVITNRYSGDIEGEGRLALLASYTSEDSASYVGQERVIGTLHGRTGSFVLRHTGIFADGVARTWWQVVAGSGTGELAGLTGDGGYAASEGRTVPGATLSYELSG
ncbi:MAG: DUF3224 family protein [Pseudonocardiaceae bacterium]|nr:DUF3224 family protein [Pseudonocardiaceae bacterium]